VSPVSALVLFLTTYDAECGLKSSWEAIVVQAYYGTTQFEESESTVRLVDKKFRKARDAYLELSRRDQNILCLAWNECNDMVPIQLRDLKAMNLSFDDPRSDTNIALLTAWLHGRHPLELLALVKKDKTVVPVMVANAVMQLSSSIQRFLEAYEKQV
jgi:hypothetical protein